MAGPQSAPYGRLLKLPASGLTDQAAGKRPGVSPRTERRQMSGLMERLNATRRFDAGLKAAQRGWFRAQRTARAMVARAVVVV